MRAIRIDVNGTVCEQRLSKDMEERWNKLGEIVDGGIEHVDLNDEFTLVMYINDAGKVYDLPENERATTLYRAYYGYTGDWIAGNAVVCGCKGEEICGLTDKQVAEIMQILHLTKH